MYGTVYQMRWWRVLLLIPLRIDLINTGLIKEVLFDFNADLTGTGGQPVCI